MWTWVDGAEDIVGKGGFAMGDMVAWPVLTTDFAELLPQLPELPEGFAGLGGEVASVVDDHGDDQIEGEITRIVMVTGRRRFAVTEITATPAEHVQVLDLAGFLVELEPDM